MHGLARGGDAVGLFMRPLLLLGPGGQIVAKRDHIGEPRRQLPIGIAKEGLQHGNAVEAEQPFIGIVQKLAQIGPRILRLRKPKPSELQDQERMLGDRQWQRPGGMAAPAIGAGEPEREIAVVPIEGGRVEEIETLARQEPDPGALLAHDVILLLAPEPPRTRSIVGAGKKTRRPGCAALLFAAMNLS